MSISVDALADRDITGTVTSVSPASGSVFSLLPPDNATGNFTKIVQRLAVRIQLPAGVAEQRMLRPGMSVIVDVNTKPQSPPPTTALGPARRRRLRTGKPQSGEVNASWLRPPQQPRFRSPPSPRWAAPEARII